MTILQKKQNLLLLTRGHGLFYFAHMALCLRYGYRIIYARPDHEHLYKPKCVLLCAYTQM